MLDLVVYKNDKKEIQRISEIHCPNHLNSVFTNIKKTCIALFLAEIIQKLLSGEDENKDMFGFLYHSIQILDETETDYENFHLIFLLRLSSFFGYAMQADVDGRLSGFSSDMIPEEKLLVKLIGQPFNHEIDLNNSQRRKILRII